MLIAYCKIETPNGEVKDFDLSDFEKIDGNALSFLERAYLYSIYYYPILSNSINETDLSQYDLYDPPYSRAVFILKNNDKFYKLNCSVSPVEYYLSNFNPETKESSIISSKPNELFTYLKSSLGVLNWDDYRQLYCLGSFTEIIDNNVSTDSLKLDFGSKPSGIDLSNAKSSASFDSIDNEVGGLKFADSSSIQTSGSYSKEQEIKTDQFDKLPIEQRRLKLKQYKEELVIAEKVRTVKNNVKVIAKQILAFENIKADLLKKEDEIQQKESGLKDFEGISWIDEKVYNNIVKYQSSNPMHKKSIEDIDMRLKKVESDILNITPDNIFKNKIFMISFPLSVISFILSWIIRIKINPFALISIALFTVSFYFLWGYVDYLDSIIKLKREKKFLIKKRKEIIDSFNTEFGSLELAIKRYKITDLQETLVLYSKLQSLKNLISKLKKENEEFKNREYNTDKINQFESLKKQKIELEGDLQRLTQKELNVEEIEQNIRSLKLSIKKYEKQELDSLSLDDDISVTSSVTPKEEVKELVFQPSNEKMEFSQNLDEIIYYLGSFSSIFNKDVNELYENIKDDFMDIFEYSIYFNHSVKVDITNNLFEISTDEKIEWNEALINKFKFFVQYSVLKYSFEKSKNPLFLKVSTLQQSLGIYLMPYIDEFRKTQVLFTE